MINIGIMFAATVYILQFLGYMIFKYRLINLKRNVISPVGNFGAVYGVLIFTLIFIGSTAFQNDNYISIIVYGCLMSIYSFIYFRFLRKHQMLSNEEKRDFFPFQVSQGM